MMAGLSNAECWHEGQGMNERRARNVRMRDPQTQRPYCSPPQARNATHRHDSPLSHFTLPFPLVRRQAHGGRMANEGTAAKGKIIFPTR